MNKRKAFLINMAKPHLALSDSFDVRESAVKLVASGLAGGERVDFQVWVGRPDLGEWVTLYRRGEQVQLTATATTHVELVPGKYRVEVTDATKGTSCAVWFEDLAQKPMMTYEKGRQQSRTTGLIADAEYGGITVSGDGSTIYVTDGDYGSVQVSGSGQNWTVTGDNVDEPVTALSSSSGELTLSCSSGDYFTTTLTEDVTTFTISNAPSAGFAQTIMLRITQDPVTPRTVAWPASFVWAGGTPGVVTAVAGAVDLLAATTFDQGTTWFTTLAGDWS